MTAFLFKNHMYADTVRKFQANPKPEKVKPYIQPSKAQEDKRLLKETIAYFKKQVKKEIRENRYGANFTFIDWEIEEDLLLITDEYYNNWKATFKPDTYFIKFLKWLKDEGFMVENIHRHDAIDKDPGEFHKIYKMRIRWV